MSVVISRNSKIFHQKNCPYVRRIREENKVQVSYKDILKQGHCACSVCSKASKAAKDIKKHGTKQTVLFDRTADALCVRTEVGFWRSKYRQNDGMWYLYHQNSKGTKCFDPVAPDDVLMQGAFHRQTDFDPTNNLNQMLEYIRHHDHYARIRDDDYRKLPKKDRKREKNRRKRQGLRTVRKLFKQLEQKKGENIT